MQEKHAIHHKKDKASAILDWDGRSILILRPESFTKTLNSSGLVLPPLSGTDWLFDLTKAIGSGRMEGCGPVTKVVGN